MRQNLVYEINGTNCVKPLLIEVQLYFSNHEDKIGTFWMSSNIR